MITDDDTKAISATSKLKTLIAYSGLKIDVNNLPVEFKNYCKSKANGLVAEATVQLRNHLVHSTEKKRKAIENLDSVIFYQARNILLHIIERYVLAIGGYEGDYDNIITNNITYKVDFELKI